MAFVHCHWTRRIHAILPHSETNALFSTLLLGIQRLEETGALPLAHQAMLEDMLECWSIPDIWLEIRFDNPVQWSLARDFSPEGLGMGE